MCLNVWLCTTSIQWPWGQTCPWIGVSCELQRGCRELNPGLLEEQLAPQLLSYLSSFLGSCLLLFYLWVKNFLFEIVKICPHTTTRWWMLDTSYIVQYLSGLSLFHTLLSFPCVSFLKNKGFSRSFPAMATRMLPCLELLVLLRRLLCQRVLIFVSMFKDYFLQADPDLFILLVTMDRESKFILIFIHISVQSQAVWTETLLLQSNLTWILSYR